MATLNKNAYDKAVENGDSSNNKKINLLVIPHLFPRFVGDLRGVFVLDYLKAVEKYCNIKVLVMQHSCERKGVYQEKIGNISFIRYTIFKNNYNIKIQRLITYISWFINLSKILKIIENVDIIHAHGATLYGNLARQIARKKNVPYVITEHTGPFSKISNKKMLRSIAKYTMENCDAVLAVSNDLKMQILNSSIYPRKFYVTYNPIDTDLFTMKNNHRDYKNFLFVGRLEKYKGALRSLIAFEKIHRKYPNWKFTIIGDGPELLEIEQYLANNHEIKKKIILKRSMNKNNLATQFKRADFFIFPSDHETFGIVIAEAMACGLPVIIGNQTAPKEFVDNDCGILVNPNDINAISDAIDYMINNSSNYMPINIREKIVNRFGFRVFGERMYNIYREFI